MKPNRNVSSIFKTEAELNERIVGESEDPIENVKTHAREEMLKEELLQEKLFRNELEIELENLEKERVALVDELKKVQLKSVASKDLQVKVEEELQEGDPENAEEIIANATARNSTEGVQKDSA